MTRPAVLLVKLFGWTLRLDRYGVSLFDTHRFEIDVECEEQAAEQAAADAEHDCRRDHPDGPCGEDVMAFRDDDLADLFYRARDGEHPMELLAEFHAGVRADPERPT